MKTAILILFSMTVLFTVSCSKETVVVFYEESQIGTGLVEEIKSFENWTLEDYKKRLAFFAGDQELFLKDFGDLGAPFNGSDKFFQDIKNGGKQRNIDWSKTEFKELDKTKNASSFKGEKTGNEYLFYEVICYAPNKNGGEGSDFSIIPLFSYDGSSYTLVYIAFAWLSSD